MIAEYNAIHIHPSGLDRKHALHCFALHQTFWYNGAIEKQQE
jgi:hypothetical protein